MKQLAPLVQREWLQHRFGWSVLMLAPTALALLLTSFGQLQFDAEDLNDRLPTSMALATLAGGVAFHFVIMWLTALIIVTGLARRDLPHAGAVVCGGQPESSVHSVTLQRAHDASHAHTAREPQT